ncbi:MAG: sigma-54-dependent Fis family transcriptional regulator [Acidobacteria bacterium]|nr:MAG: sigma-54-dependent Fis family transcriptional regulator [Acidobacteriota bacterium]
MGPALIAIFGSLKGSTLPIVQDEVTIGRDKSNWLSIPDPLLSRQHCAIKKDADGFTIADRNSRNGIFVNGIPVKERKLEHGDQIELGDSLFLFVLHTESVSSPSIKSSEVLHSTTSLRLQDSVYLSPSRLKESSKSNQDLKLLLDAALSVHSIPDKKKLCKKILDLFLNAIPAESGVVVLINSVGEFVVLAGDPEDVNSSVVQQALNREALMTCEIEAVLCVPLIVFNKKLGAVYLQTKRGDKQFQESDLQLAAGIAALSSVALSNVQHFEMLEEENSRLQRELNVPQSIVGDSATMRKTFDVISRIAPTDSTILICGESGTGKELAARAIHLNSSRAKKPFVAINCAALAETLLESELFGHEKGAFTGAIAQKKGKLEIANGGTLFLDEVSEIAPVLQAKFLRFLQEREFERVGGTKPIPVDIRVIAATNRNLEDAIQAGSFRKDFFFRLNVVTLQMPCLRERRDDIPLLANYFIAKYGKKMQRKVKAISPQALDLLMRYDWPGNVRELENVIERAIVLGAAEEILPEDLPENLMDRGTACASPARFHEAIHEAKRRVVREALDRTGGNHSEAAKLLGLHPNYLYRLMHNLGLDEK